MSRTARAILTVIVSMIGAAVAAPATPLPEWLRPILAAGIVGAASVGIVPPTFFALRGSVSTGYFSRPTKTQISDALREAHKRGLLDDELKQVRATVFDAHAAQREWNAPPPPPIEDEDDEPARMLDGLVPEMPPPPPPVNPHDADVKGE